MSEQEVSARRFGCPSCGGLLRYDIGRQTMLCEQCGTERPPWKMPSEKGEDQSDTVEVTAYRCPQCGAEIVSATTEATGFCSYCGSDVVLEQKLSRMQRPSKILPFTLTREKCEEIYRRHIRSHVLAPGDLLKQSVVGHFRPVYVPFWSMSVKSRGPMSVRCSNVSVSSRKTVCSEWQYDLSVDMEHRGILYDASRAFEDDTAVRLDYGMSDLLPFRSCYLSGMYAQAPDAAAEFYENEAASSASLLLLHRLVEKSNLVAVRPLTDGGALTLPDVHVDRELVLMPVWLLAHRQNGRMLYAAVNGRSGRIVCDVPVSATKICVSTLLLAAVLFAILYLLPVMRADWLVAPCMAASLVIQYMICVMKRRLVYHDRREGEPDFDSPPGMTRPIRRIGKVENGQRAFRMPGSPAVILTTAIACIALIGALCIVGSFLVSAYYSSALYGASSTVLGVILTGAVGLTHFLCFYLIAHMPRCPEKTAAFRQNSIMLTLDMLCVVLLFLRLAEDLIYYGVCIALMVFSLVAMYKLWQWHNRFTTRPVPFFDPEKEAEEP